MKTITEPVTTLTQLQKAVCTLVSRFTTLSTDPTLFPTVGPMVHRILQILAEQAVRIDEGRPLTSGELASAIGTSNDRINDNINRLPCLIQYYAGDLGLTVRRFAGARKGTGGRTCPGYQLAITAPTVSRMLSIGQWLSVKDSMPDDDITHLVWSTHLNDATLAAHDSEVLARRGDSGWIMAGTSGRVILGVSHYCPDINPPIPATIKRAA